MTQAIARRVGRPVGECHAMYKMLKDYERLGGVSVMVQDGIRVTKCPPASAQGVGSGRLSAGGRDDSSGVGTYRTTTSIPETRLAAAKLLVMFETLGGRIRESCPPGARQKIIDEAHRWFFGRSDLDWWCEAANRDPESVRKKARQIADGEAGLNMESRRNGWSDQEIELLLKEKAKGMSNEEVASKLGRSRATINSMHYNLRKKEGVASP